MQAKVVALLLLQAIAALATSDALEARQDSAPVLTAQRVFQTLISESPFIIEQTTTITWTQSPSITEDQPTTPPTPSIATPAVA